MTHAVLLVEDDDRIARLLSIRLEAAGFAVTHCSTGTEAVEAAITTAPQFAVLDIRIPGLDGIEVCARIRSTPQCHDMSIIFYSAHSQATIQERARQAGGDRFIAKTLGAEAVISAIRELEHAKSQA